MGGDASAHAHLHRTERLSDKEEVRGSNPRAPTSDLQVFLRLTPPLSPWAATAASQAPSASRYNPRMSRLISIGRFANLTDLSHRQLRKLDERGLLSPAYVDPDTHYRYYDYGQARRASLIHLCLQLHLTPGQIRDLIAADHPATLRSHLERHRARLAENLGELTRVLALLDQELMRQAHPFSYQCALKDVPAQLVAAARGSVPRRHPHDPWDVERAQRLTEQLVLGWLADHGVESANRPLILYFNDMERDEDVTFNVCFPLGGPVPEGGGVTCRELPPVRVAFTVHRGGYDTIWNAYAELHSWASEHGYDVDGPAREIALVHEDDTPDQGQWVTEIALPLAD
jgi:DNA-binding transcriptional MerR regulator/effector-binding domain-containing protein